MSSGLSDGLSSGHKKSYSNANIRTEYSVCNKRNRLQTALFEIWLENPKSFSMICIKSVIIHLILQTLHRHFYGLSLRVSVGLSSGLSVGQETNPHPLLLQEQIRTLPYRFENHFFQFGRVS